MDATELILVRHGETEWNQQQILQGHADSPLTTAGVAQAHVVGQRIAQLNPEIIYSSDLGRAYTTAQIVATYHPKPIRPEQSLRERCLGIFQGFSWPQIQQQFPQVYQEYNRHSPDYVIPEGESYLQFVQRVMAGVEQIAVQHPQQKVLVVTHGGVIGALIRQILSIPYSAPRRFSLKNTSVNRVHFRNGEWMVETFGDISHLEARVNTRDDEEDA